MFLLQMFKNYFFIFITLSFMLLFMQALPPPLLAVFYRTKLIKYRANLAVFRGTVTRPPLENMLCVDLCYLIFRTCLALKAMMVCMAKDLLAYTAAMAVGVINRKVIYVSHFIRMLLLNNRLVTRSRVDGVINGHRKRISFCNIKCVLVYNRHNKLRIMTG